VIFVVIDRTFGGVLPCLLVVALTLKFVLSLNHGAATILHSQWGIITFCLLILRM